MEPLKFDQQLSEDDYAALLIFSVFERKKFNKIFLLYVTPALGLIFLLFFIFIGTRDFTAIFISCFLMVFGPLFRWFFVYLGKKAYRKSVLLQVKSEVTFSEVTIEATSERGTSKYFYTDISNVYETRRYFIIYLGMAHYIGIVKVIIGESNCEQIKNILLEKTADKYIDRT
jgi:hypothetical protein